MDGHFIIEQPGSSLFFHYAYVQESLRLLKRAGFRAIWTRLIMTCLGTWEPSQTPKIHHPRNGFGSQTKQRNNIAAVLFEHIFCWFDGDWFLTHYHHKYIIGGSRIRSLFQIPYLPHLSALGSEPLAPRHPRCSKWRCGWGCGAGAHQNVLSWWVMVRRSSNFGQGGLCDPRTLPVWKQLSNTETGLGKWDFKEHPRSRAPSR